MPLRIASFQCRLARHAPFPLLRDTVMAKTQKPLGITRESKGSALTRKDKRANKALGLNENGTRRKRTKSGKARKAKRGPQEMLEALRASETLLIERIEVARFYGDGQVRRLRIALGQLGKAQEGPPMNGFPRLVLELRGMLAGRISDLRDGAAYWDRQEQDEQDDDDA